MAANQIKGSGTIPGTPYKFVFGTMTFDNSYPTGGEALDLSTELDEVIFVAFEHQSATVSGGTTAAALRYDRTNKKVMAYGGAAANTELTEFTATKDLSAFAKVGFMAFGFKA